MSNKNIIICFFLFVSNFYFAFGSQEQRNCSPVHCSPQLQGVLSKIQKLPEANQLIAEIQQEGNISIVVNKTGALEQFGAFWDPDRRIIAVSVSENRSQGELIGSILFELQNAKVNQRINYLDGLASRGEIGKEKYVQSFEHLEYINSLRASKMAEKGIALGIFPASAHLPTYKNFEEHYYYQQVGGHSDCVAQKFDQIRLKY